MKALVLTPCTRSTSVEDIPRPIPKSGEVLIRVKAIALNPVDQIYVSTPIATQEKRVIGTDFAGVVVEVSPELGGSSDTRAKPGTRVAGFLQGACSVNDRPGAFAEYITAPYDLTWAIPPGMSLEEASTVSMCSLTAAQGLYARLGLPNPFSDLQAENDHAKPINVFIYGSSTSVGLYAAQLVHLSALASGTEIRLIGAASRSKHDFLRQEPYGYDVLVDYHAADWVEQVKTATGGNGVDFALDCISEGATVYGTHETLATGAKFAVFRGPVGGRYDPSKLRIKPIYGAVWEGLGVEIGYNGTVIPASQEAREFARQYFDFLAVGTSSGRSRIEPNPVRIMPGGFERVVPDGFTLLGSGSVSQRSNVKGGEEHMGPISAEKLVYRV
ncbi:uncharacterized protein NECHADRAFT_85264 [Fusarium vanettenii 77-13-4]|uniref:Enoyl reductase (ER) domain-containing protein n=1 Tax=Fusarium vanettenii (strain ATCC MYA-4622 / CBS 123669 / FGSC 9596 / NRRL 45880 / 77-13-4) TaxID=660122 RepID=C7YVG1_FUSV7|nr:uncharacterized protein NECHADRAFT_85264 [Fusarium vanettenii 77-13-4]EEU44581.1 hypothetical protein NECHADRAFT_85264 [Fusarium vanettenii 77-13-4]